MQVDGNFWSGKKCFITGGTGFIGTHLVNKLLSIGADVLVLEHETKSEFKSIVGDIVHIGKEFECQLKEYSPDVVFHLAAQPIVNYAEDLLEETLDVNIVGTYKLYLILKNIKSVKSIIHISTDKVYGDIPIITLDEIPYGIKHPYNVSKLSSDAIARMLTYMFDMPICIIRNGNIYGAGDNHLERLIPSVATEILRGNLPVVRGDGKMTRDYIHVSDIVIGYLNAAQHTYEVGYGDIFLMGSAKSYTVMEVIQQIYKSCGLGEGEEVIHKPALKGEIEHQHIVDTLSRDVLGWNPTVLLDEGILLTIPYYEEKINK